MKPAEALDVLPPQERRDSIGRRRLCSARRGELVREFQISGLSVAAFARRHGLCYTTVVSWLRRAGVIDYAKPVSSTSSTIKTTKVTHPVEPAFRELTVAPSASVAPGSTIVVILPGGIEARCVDVVTAAGLIKALREVR